MSPASETRALVLLYGGTFDPVHRGHLDAACFVRDRTACDALHLLPSARPPLRDAPGADARQRRRMLELAVEGLDGIDVDARELERDEPSWTVRTLELVREELGAGVALAWVIGLDALAGLDRWHRWRELPDLAHLIVLDRPGHDWPDAGPVRDLLASRRVDEARALRAAPAGAVWSAAQPPQAISATEVRRIIGQGGDPGGLLPASVWAYIRAEGLYGAVRV